jgi:hypothetical protein
MLEAEDGWMGFESGGSGTDGRRNKSTKKEESD